MRIRPFRLSVAACAAALFVAAAPRAAADTLTLQFDGTLNTSGVGPGGVAQVSYSLNGSPGSSTPSPYYWDATPPVGGGNNPVSTFCIELTEGLPSNSVTFNVVPVSDATQVMANNSDPAAVADAIQALYGNYYDPKWNNPSKATQDPSFSAFQLALWELVYDGSYDIAHPGQDWLSPYAGSTTNPYAGQLTSTDGTASTALSMLTTTLGDVQQGLTNFHASLTGMELVALVNSGTQDQLILRPTPKVVGVPAPPAAVLAGLGFLALAGRFRRRTPAAA